MVAVLIASQPSLIHVKSSTETDFKFRNIIKIYQTRSFFWRLTKNQLKTNSRFSFTADININISELEINAEYIHLLQTFLWLRFTATSFLPRCTTINHVSCRQATSRVNERLDSSVSLSNDAMLWRGLFIVMAEYVVTNLAFNPYFAHSALHYH